MSSLKTVLAGAAAVMVLAQCQSTTQPSAPTVLIPPTTQPASIAARSNEDGGSIFNAYRAYHNRPAVRPNTMLNRAAMAHARDMGTNNFMSHTSSNGDSVRDRASKQGYRACWIAENVGLGQSSANEVIAQWMNSPSHRKNMLHSRTVEYGLARGPANAWVLVVAEPGCG